MPSQGRRGPGDSHLVPRRGSNAAKISGSPQPVALCVSSTLALLYATKHTVAVYYAALMWQQVTDTKPHQVTVLSQFSLTGMHDAECCQVV